jgi:hypothetical protein
MRKVAFFLLLGCATLGHGIAATAAETWKWKDANGVVHYSDQPAPGAERMEVVVPKPSSSTPRQATAEAAPRAAAAAPDANQPANVPYTRCVITAPDSEETFNATTTVTVGLLVEPALQAGHHIEVLFDGGAVQDWPPTAVSHTLKDLQRGSHTVSARVLDANGGTACSGPALNFHVRLPTVAPPKVQHH